MNRTVITSGFLINELYPKGQIRDMGIASTLANWRPSALLVPSLEGDWKNRSKHSLFADYALDFIDQGVSDFANIWGMSSLTQFTVCLWMKSSDPSHHGTLFSYAVTGSDDELAIEDYNAEFYRLSINGARRLDVC